MTKRFFSIFFMKVSFGLCLSIVFSNRVFCEQAYENWEYFKSAVPIPLFSHFQEKFSDVFISGQACFALTEDGRVYSWGSKSNRILGHGNLEGQQSFAEVYDLRNKDTVLIIGKFGKNYALTINKEIYAWGDNSYGELGLGNRLPWPSPCKVSFSQDDEIVKILSSGDNTFIFTGNFKVYGWGKNNNGELGLGDNDSRNYPTHISTLEGKSIKQFYSSFGHSFVLYDNNAVYGWGKNNNGELGLGDNASRKTPTIIEFLKDIVILKVIVGFDSSLFLTQNGDVYASGKNNHGQLGLGDRESRNKKYHIAALKDIVEIFGEFRSYFALTHDGRVYAWGDNSSGQLGLGHREDILLPTLMSIAFVSKIIAITEISKFISYSYALTHDGRVYAWGDNSSGQLGLGHREDELTPKLLPRELFWDDDVVKIVSFLDYKDFSFSIRCFPLDNGECFFDKNLGQDIHNGKPYAKTLALTREGKLFAWGEHSLFKIKHETKNDIEEKILYDEKDKMFFSLLDNLEVSEKKGNQFLFEKKLKAQIKHEAKVKIKEDLKAKEKDSTVHEKDEL